MFSTKLNLAEKIYSAFNSSFPGCEVGKDDIMSLLTSPPDKAMGDLAMPCFKFAKSLRTSPVNISNTLASALQDIEGIKVESVNGYLNVFIDRNDFFKKTAEKILSQKKDYGKTETGKGKTIVLDYSSPNVAKPFHVGHLGTTVIGHSLKKLFAFAGYNCIGVNHLGDWGTQFGKLIVAYKKWGDEKKVEEGGIDELVALYVKFHEEAEKDPALADQARAHFAALERKEPEETALWEKFIDISIKEYKKTYEQLDIEFDYYTGESFYSDKMPAVIEDMKAKNLLTLNEGASVVELEEYGMPPCLILKTDGATLYPTRDISAALYRKNTFDFHKCIYVTSAAQSLHFAQWFRVMALMGYDWYEDLVHVPYGTVSINGEKLATRTGNVVLLKDLFATATEKAADIMAEKNPALAGNKETAEAVGIGAVIFYYLSANKIRDINFVMQDALNFDGNTGPYAQYTYARTCSIASKAEEMGITPTLSGDVCEDEFVLIKTLSVFPDMIADAIREYEPSIITRYILDICADFNRFYHNCQILSAEDDETKKRRLALTLCTKYTLASALELICMKHPEKI